MMMLLPRILPSPSDLTTASQEDLFLPEIPDEIVIRSDPSTLRKSQEEEEEEKDDDDDVEPEEQKRVRGMQVHFRIGRNTIKA